MTSASSNNYFENYSYELSDFQKQAIMAIVEGNHVLVTAHTGSGKTLPAEFAIEHFVKMGKKVIYTSPIKALSNQKYYDFSKKYPHISFGLLTGDIKTNPGADVLIMTTEILMNRLFELSDLHCDQQTSKNKNAFFSFDINIQEELAAVVFDECHYINDKHRGQVWEQSIMMLPPQVQMIMLSATIDNPARFAHWCESVKEINKKSVVICSTNHRVVPLTHYVFMTSTEGLFKKMKDKDAEATVRKSLCKCLTIQEADGKFRPDTYNTVSNITNLMTKHDMRNNRQFVLNELIGHLHKESMLPAIVFVFSRKQVEQCAQEVQVNLLDEESQHESNPYNIKKECDAILRRLPNWREYADLPEYKRLVSLLQKGVGIHHSGMIPILREIVELMISKKYIKVLFATESFAIGLDCPIKTAVFINLKKHDGGEHPRYLMSHEYTQMAGRAGRRGIDTIGNVIHCSNLFDLPDITTYKEILGGVPQKLTSKFQIYYPMILNLLSDNSSEYDMFIKKSMLSLELETMEIGLKKQIAEFEIAISEKKDGFKTLKCAIEILQEFHDLNKSLELANNKKRKEVDKKIAEILKSNPTITKDIAHFREYESLKVRMYAKECELASISRYISDQINNVIGILRKYKIVQADSPTLTDVKGQICRQIAEVNPVLMTELIVAWNDFADFNPTYLAGFLSIFADVRGNNGDSRNNSRNNFFIEHIRNFNWICDSLIDAEEDAEIYSGESLYGFSYTIIDDVLDWCACENEDECKAVLRRLDEDKGVSVGDFTKAMLKISTVARELISVCENTGKIDLMNRLSKIDGLILKHVSTNQSLYL